MKSIILSAGRECFVACKGCYNFFSKNRNLISTQEIAAFLNYMKNNNLKKVTLAGGDPLSRPDIVDLIQTVKETGLYVNLDTVGTPFLGERKTIFQGKSTIPQVPISEISPYVDMVGIPIDGPNSAVIQKFRKGRSEIYKEQVQIVELLASHNVPISLNTVVHRHNIDCMESTLQDFDHIPSIQKWQFFQFMPIGPSGSREERNMSISAEQYDAFITQIQTAEDICSDKLRQALEFKSCNDRTDAYIMIDTAGDAWVPKTALTGTFNNVEDNGQKIVIGNIGNQNDFENILQYAQNGIIPQMLRSPQPAIPLTYFPHRPKNSLDLPNAQQPQPC